MNSLRVTGSLGFALALGVACGGRSAQGNFGGSTSSDPDASLGGSVSSGGEADAGILVSAGGASAEAGSGAGGNGGTGGSIAGGTSAGGTATAGRGAAGAPASPELCDYGSYDTDLEDDELTCEPWTVCGPGSYQLEIGGYTYDRQCEACAEGTFTTTSTALLCDSWSRCSFGEQVESEPTASTDRECAASEEFPVRHGTGGPLVFADGAVQFLVSPADLDVIVMDTNVLSYSLEGESLDAWLVSEGEGEYINDMAQVGDEIFLVGSQWAEDAALPPGFVRKLTPTGGVEWAEEIGTPPERLNALVADGREGLLHVAGFIYAEESLSPDLVHYLVGPDGAVVTTLLEEAANLTGNPLFIAVASSGNFYVGAQRFNETDETSWAVVREYDVDGGLIEELTFQNEYISGFDADAEGGVYVLTIGDMGRIHHIAAGGEIIASGDLDPYGAFNLSAMSATADGAIAVGNSEQGPALLRVDEDVEFVSLDVLTYLEIPTFSAVQELEDGTVLVAGTSRSSYGSAFVARWH